MCIVVVVVIVDANLIIVSIFCSVNITITTRQPASSSCGGHTLSQVVSLLPFYSSAAAWEPVVVVNNVVDSCKK